MASINQLVSEIAHSVQGADNIPTRRGIRLAIIHARNKLIRHSYETHGYIDRVIQQRYRVALVDVGDGDIDYTSAGISDKDYKIGAGIIKRTLNKVPRPTRLTNNLPFSAVKTVGIKNPIVNDIYSLVNKSNIKAIFFNGKKSFYSKNRCSR